MVALIIMIIPLDDNGFLVNEGRVGNIPPRLKTIIEDIVIFSKKELGDNLLSAYIRGSVSVGRFINNVSDIDFVVITKTEPSLENFSSF